MSEEQPGKRGASARHWADIFGGFRSLHPDCTADSTFSSAKMVMAFCKASYAPTYSFPCCSSPRKFVTSRNSSHLQYGRMPNVGAFFYFYKNLVSSPMTVVLFSCTHKEGGREQEAGHEGVYQTKAPLLAVFVHPCP